MDEVPGDAAPVALGYGRGGMERNRWRIGQHQGCKVHGTCIKALVHRDVIQKNHKTVSNLQTD